MMEHITQHRVEHLAELARIAMDDRQIEQMTREIAVIVDAVQSVQEAAIDEVPAMSHPMPQRNVFREDVVGPVLGQEAVLAGAPQQQEGQFRVPALLEEA